MLPCAIRRRSASGVLSTSSTCSARRTTSSGIVSRCSIPVISSTTSFIDSRCWMFTVVITSIPASSSSSTSCQRFSWRQPGTFVWASSSTSATFGFRARTASTSISSNVAPRYSTVRRGTTSSVADLRGGVLASVRLDVADDHVGAACQSPATLVEHREGLPDAGRGSEVDTELPAGHRRSLECSLRPVERHVELEDVDPRLAEEAERAIVGVLVDERVHLGDRHPAHPRHPAGLDAGVRDRDVRVEP